MQKKLKYGNWIRVRALWGLWLTAVVLGAIASLPLPAGLRLLAGGLGIITGISFLFPFYAYLMFSPTGGNLQQAIYNVIIAKLGKSEVGNILDIGAGNGVLAVELALAHPHSTVTGLDYWGKNWEYGKSVCEENAQVARVQSRTRFVKGNAAALDFDDTTFDAVVSNLTFHEVKSAPDKRDVLLEALRVLKPGGVFAFVDYFYDGRYYGRTADFEAFLKDKTGLSRVRLEPLSHSLHIPWLLRHPRALGKVGIVYGVK